MKIRTVSVASVLCAVLATSVQASQWTATPTTFQSVMAAAVGGDTVKLVGTFGLTKLSNTHYNSLVTINASAATFSNTLLLTNVSNINVIGGKFGSSSAVTQYNKAVLITGGNNVTFTRPTVTGYYTGQGIAFQDTTNVKVTGATLSKLHAGVVFAGVIGGSISNSRSIGSVSDGFDIVDSSRIDIGNNSCTGSTPTVGAHPDCVQLFSTDGAAAMDHIDIHNNRMTGNSQGFDNFGANPGSSFISIVDNRVDGLFPQGIACYYCVNSTITGNTLTSLDGAPYTVNLNVLYGTNNTVSGNTIGQLNRSKSAAIVYYTREQLIAGSNTLHRTSGALGMDLEHGASGAIGMVPEPGTWAMLIAGFGLVGFSQRRRDQYLPA